ncbi:MAG: NUDIX domain-containing protein [Sandaracinaceae bacterium]
MSDVPVRVAVVDERNRFVRWTDRAEIHADRIPHRSVQVLLLDSRGRLVLQRRAAEKRTHPRHWDISASGHVEEPDYPDPARPDDALDGIYASVARRELSEELGVDADLAFLGTFAPEPDVHYEHLALYVGTHDGPYTPQPEEVEEIRAFDPEALDALFASGDLVTRSLVWFVAWARARGVLARPASSVSDEATGLISQPGPTLGYARARSGAMDEIDDDDLQEENTDPGLVSPEERPDSAPSAHDTRPPPLPARGTANPVASGSLSRPPPPPPRRALSERPPLPSTGSRISTLPRPSAPPSGELPRTPTSVRPPASAPPPGRMPSTRPLPGEGSRTDIPRPPSGQWSIRDLTRRDRESSRPDISRSEIGRAIAGAASAAAASAPSQHEAELRARLATHDEQLAAMREMLNTLDVRRDALAEELRVRIGTAERDAQDLEARLAQMEARLAALAEGTELARVRVRLERLTHAHTELEQRLGAIDASQRGREDREAREKTIDARIERLESLFAELADDLRHRDDDAGIDALSARLDGLEALVLSRPSEPPRGRAPDVRSGDDLTRIKGIGPKFAKALAEMGVHRIAQIATWDVAEIERVATVLRIKASRVAGWPERARELSGA